ncbi:MAG: hypothetical protein QM642_04545 [Edaphocola sp.]
MLAHEEKYIHDWESKRSKGKWTYVSLTSLVWGIVLPLLVLSFKLATGGQLTAMGVWSHVCSYPFFLLCVKFVMGVFLFALFMWHLAQKKYSDLKRKAEGEKHPPTHLDLVHQADTK